MSRLRVGTRGSDLALWQTNWVCDRLREVHADLEIEQIIIKTARRRCHRQELRPRLARRRLRQRPGERVARRARRFCRAQFSRTCRRRRRRGWSSLPRRRAKSRTTCCSPVEPGRSRSCPAGRELAPTARAEPPSSCNMASLRLCRSAATCPHASPRSNVRTWMRSCSRRRG